MEITYSFDIMPTAAQVSELYESSGMPRPTNDPERMKKMFDNSGIVITAWDGDLLLGVARAITDFEWTCYLSDLAVRAGYKGAGIGKNLVDLLKNKVGDKCMIVLLSLPDATEFYSKIGFTKQDSCFLINRLG